MPTPEAALALATAMADELEDYLLSDELFWTLSRRPALGPAPPRLTLGGLQLALDVLEAHDEVLPPARRTAAARLRRRVEALAARRAAAWARKAVRELAARARMWEAYILEIREQPDRIAEYAQQARPRAMAERLAPVAAPGVERERALERLRQADDRLRAGFEPGPFVWEPALARQYPAGPFWFLYGRPRPRDYLA